MSKEILVQPDETQLSIKFFIPEVLGRALDDAMFLRPELFGLDETALWKKLKLVSSKPTPTDNRLRLKFWMEFDRCQVEGEKAMNMAAICAGICSRTYFYNDYVKFPEKMAWLLCPPAGYIAKTEEALEFGIEQLRDILDQDHVWSSGKLDHRLIGLKIRIVEMLDIRVKGAVVQKTMNMNVNAKALGPEIQELSEAELDKRLKELKRRELASRNMPAITVEVDTDPIPGD